MFETLKATNKTKELEKRIESAVNERVSDILKSVEYDKKDNVIHIKSGKLKDKKGKLVKSGIIVKDNFISKQSQSKNGSNGVILTSPYDYSSIDTFFSKESYYARSISRQYETMLRNGFGFVSDDNKYTKIVKTSIFEIEKNNMVKLDQTFSKIHMDLSKYGICIIQKMYTSKADKISGKSIRRISKLRIISPHGCRWYFDKDGVFQGIDTGSSVNYPTIRNSMSGRLQRLFDSTTGKTSSPSIKSEDLIILRIYQDDDQFFPEPHSLQMLDDILTLRSIEETIELLIFQYGSPMLQANVGTEEDPARPGEVDTVAASIESMASNGFITTDHRVKLTPINLLNNVGDFTSILEYFKTRILVGSGSSSISVGEGNTANRSTAESIDDALADHCMYFANIICFMMNYYVIPEIIATETGEINSLFNVNGDFNVRMSFNEMKLEKQIAIENSAVNLYHANILPFNRVLKRLKETPLNDDEEKDLYLHNIQIPLAEASAKEAGAVNENKKQNQPSNQHGEKPAPGSSKN
jgi:hypothetical protein